MRNTHSISSRFCLAFIVVIFLVQGSIPNTGFCSYRESAGPSHTLAPASSLVETEPPLLIRVKEIRQRRPVRAKMIANIGPKDMPAEYLREMSPSVSDAANVDIGVVVPTTLVDKASKEAEGLGLSANFCVCAQDISEVAELGAFTGESVPQLLKQAGARAILIGHSDRRFAPGKTENHETIVQKIKNARAQGMRVILAISETVSARREGKTFEFIDEQISKEYEQLTQEERAGVDIAYEPLWAAGGEATPEQIETVHRHIRLRLAEISGADQAADTRILYAGEAKAETLRPYLEKANIDGAVAGKQTSRNASAFAAFVKVPTTVDRFSKITAAEEIFGEQALPGDREITIKVGSEIIARGRWNEKEGILKTIPVKPLVSRHDYEVYAGQMLAYLDEWTGKSQTKIQWQDRNGAKIRWVMNDRTGATRPGDNPGEQTAPLSLDYVHGTRHWYGSDLLLQIEYGGTEHRRPTLLTMKETDAKQTGGYEFIVQPKKTVLINGFGTIGAQVGYWARRAGFHVIAGQRSPNERAVYANALGMRLYLTDPSKSADFDTNKIKYATFTEKKWEGDKYVDKVKPRSVEMLLQENLVDVIVDATDGKTKYKDPATGKDINMKVAEYNKLTLYNKYPAVKVMFEGAEDPELADGTFEAVTWLQAGLEFNIQERDRSLFCPSCNTTMQLNVVSSLLSGIQKDASLKEGKLSAYLTTTRRTGDPGGGKHSIPPDGIAIESHYHHAEDVLAVLPESLKDNIHRAEDGSLVFTTDASAGHQTKFHVGHAILEFHHPDGKRLTADWVKEQLRKTGRIAVVDFPKGRFDSSNLIDVIQNKIRHVHPFVGIAQVVDIGGGKIQVNFLTPQESNVIPNNVSAIQVHTGVEQGEGSTARSVRFVNDLMGLTRMRMRIESYLPEKDRKVTQAFALAKRTPRTQQLELKGWQKDLVQLREETGFKGNATPATPVLGYGLVAYNCDATDAANIQALFGDAPEKEASYQILTKDGQVFALVKITPDGIMRTQSVLPPGLEREYICALMEYGDLVSDATGKTLEIQDKDGELLKSILNQTGARYTSESSPGIQESMLRAGDLHGTFRWHGEEQLLQIEYSTSARDDEKNRTLLTVNDRNALGPKPVSFIIQPSKKVVIHGTGARASELAHWTRLAGFKVFIALSDPDQNAIHANLEGFPLLLADEEKKSFFTAAGINYNGLLLDMIMQGRADIVVNMTDGMVPSGNTEIPRSVYYQQKLYSGNPSVRVIYQGSDLEESETDRSLADRELDIPTSVQAGADGKLGGAKSVYIPPSNAAMQRAIISPLLREFKNLEVYVSTRMSTANPGAGANAQSAPADGITVTPVSRDAKDFLAGLPAKLKDNLKTVDGKPDYKTARTVGHQTKFHVVEAIVKAPGLTAQRVKELLNQQERIAVVDFPNDKFDSSKFVDIVLNRLGIVHPMIGFAQVLPLDGGKIKINFVVPQESNVIPNEISAVQAMTGVMEQPKRSYDFVDRLIGLEDIALEAEKYMPQIPAIMLEVKALRHGEYRPRAYMAGNWKANVTKAGPVTTELMKTGNLMPDQANRVAITQDYLPTVQAAQGDNLNTDMTVFVPHDLLRHTIEAANRLAFPANFTIGAEDVSDPENPGTGEITVELLKQAGVKVVLIGHSERRTVEDKRTGRRKRPKTAEEKGKLETHESVVRKIKALRAAGIRVVLAIGETYAERRDKKTFEIINEQLVKEYGKLTPEEREGVDIAYEPVWAIGATAKPATPEQAEEVHAYIRLRLAELTDARTAARTRIMYGGNMNPDNVASLMSKENIDGGLVGGASLDAASFNKIAKAPMEIPGKFAQALPANSRLGQTQTFYSRIARYVGLPELLMDLGDPELVAEHRRIFHDNLILQRSTLPVLDSGTATGEDASWFASQGHPTVGVDFSSAMIGEARRRNVGANIDFQVSDIRRLNLADNSVAGVWDNGTFDHLTTADAARVLDEYHRVLPADGSGILFIRVKKGKGEKSQIDPTFGFGRRYTKLWELKELTDFLLVHGFIPFDSGEEPPFAPPTQPGKPEQWIYVAAVRPLTEAVRFGIPQIQPVFSAPSTGGTYARIEDMARTLMPAQELVEGQP